MVYNAWIVVFLLTTGKQVSVSVIVWTGILDKTVGFWHVQQVQMVNNVRMEELLMETDLTASVFVHLAFQGPIALYLLNVLHLMMDNNVWTKV